MVNVFINDKTELIHLGKQNENLAICLKWNVTKWVAAFGIGAVQILVQRHNDPAAYPYDAELEVENGCYFVSFPITSTNTASAGYGKIELNYVVEDVVVKSQIWKTEVESSLNQTSTAPAPWSTWVEEIANSRDEAVAAATSAEDAEANTAAMLTEVEEKTQEAAESSATAVAAAETATNAKNQAYESALSAETAKNLCHSYLDTVHADALSASYAANAADLASQAAINAKATVESTAEIVMEESTRAQFYAFNAQIYAENAAASDSSAKTYAASAKSSADTAARTISNIQQLATQASTSASQAQNYAQQAHSIKESIEAAAVHEPTIGDNGNWWIWNQDRKSYIDSTISARPEFIAVGSLPVVGLAGVIYLVPNGSEGTNTSDEYVWIPRENRYELIGSTAIDLSQYYKKSEVDVMIQQIWDYILSE